MSPVEKVAGLDPEPPPPCCDYRDHWFTACACPEHPRDDLHVFGYISKE